MAYAFAHGSSALPEDWTITSRGTQVGGRRAPMCEVSASLVEGGDGAEQFVSAQRSSPVNTAHLTAQDLIIVASAAERAAIARLNPDLRVRTFTLREAIALGRDPVTRRERDRILTSRPSAARVRLHGYPDALNGRRGLIATPSPHRKLLPWQSEPPHPFDIPDAHQLRAKQHLATLRDLRDDVSTFREQLSRYLADAAE